MTSDISMRAGPTPIGNKLFLRVMDVDVTSYESGGEPVALNDVGFRRFTNVRAIATSNDDVIAKWDEGQQAVRLIDLSSGDSSGSELAAEGTQDVILHCYGV